MSIEDKIVDLITALDRNSDEIVRLREALATTSANAEKVVLQAPEFPPITTGSADSHEKPARKRATKAEMEARRGGQTQPMPATTSIFPDVEPPKKGEQLELGGLGAPYKQDAQINPSDAFASIFGDVSAPQHIPVGPQKPKIELPVVNADQLRQIFQKMWAVNNAAVGQLLMRYGVSSIPELKPEVYGEVAKIIELFLAAGQGASIDTCVGEVRAAIYGKIEG